MQKNEYFKAIAQQCPEAKLVYGEALNNYTQNASAFSRSVIAAIQVKDKDSIQKIIKLSNQFSIPLYPISQGKNWGLGSKLPVTNDCVILDMSQMNAISEVNDTFGYAIIEPGVTQQQLSCYLEKKNYHYFSDATGSAEQTSIIGNALERGVAYNSLRAEKLINLEVITGNGDIVKTGFSHYDNSPLAPLNRFGVGPSLMELFIQSNLGIVVSATIELLPRPPSHFEEIVFSLFVNEDNVGPALEKLKQLKTDGVLNSVVHIANKQRTYITYAPTLYEACKKEGLFVTREDIEQMIRLSFGDGWVVIGSLSGLPGHVREAHKLTKKAIKPFGKVIFQTPLLKKIANLAFALPIIRGKPKLTSHKLNTIISLGLYDLFQYAKRQRLILLAATPFFGMSLGKPTDAAIRSVYWPNALEAPKWQQPDKGDSGILFSCPIVPMSTSCLSNALNIIKQIESKFSVCVAATFNMQNDKTLEGVLSIDFDKKKSNDAKNAQAAISEMNQAFIEIGFIPYRNTINDIDKVIDTKDNFWTIVAQIKSVLDPNCIIAPGRYGPKTKEGNY